MKYLLLSHPEYVYD